MNFQDALNMVRWGRTDGTVGLHVRRRSIRRNAWPPGKYVFFDDDAYLLHFKGKGLGNPGQFMLVDPKHRHPRPFTFDILEDSIYSIKDHGLNGEYVTLALEACQATEEDMKATDWEIS